MKTFSKIIKVLPIVLFMFCYSTSLRAQYEINSEFGNLVDFDTLTSGIYIVWWDNQWDYSTDAEALLDIMNDYRDVCLGELEMQDPPNPTDGYYYNVYLHRSDDLFPSWWGNGQGTDVNGYPYLTLPIGAHNDWVNVAHETFHVFQYSSNSPGFAYSGDSQWYIEASANWFAAKQNENVDGAFLEAESLVRLPHVPLWLSYDNFPASYPQNWQRYVHQYALALLLYYMSEETTIPDEIVTNGLYAGTDDLPQEYFYNQLGGEVFREIFLDWAAHMTNYFDFLPANQISRFELEWDNYADPADDNEFIAVYTNEGSDGWVQPANEKMTTGWSYNTYKLNNSENENYVFEVQGAPTGTLGSDSFFQSQVVVVHSNTGSSFYDLTFENDQNGALGVSLTEDDTAVYFVIASMPNHFTDVDQRFPYEMRIGKGETLGIDALSVQAQSPKLMARYDLWGRQIQATHIGIQILKYNDGSVKKVYNSGTD
jgi:hypothetical protein